MGLIGTIVQKDGALCVKLENSPTWYPVDGMSAFALKLREAIGRVQPGDAGKRVFNVRGVLQVENVEQRDTRLREEYRKLHSSIADRWAACSGETSNG